MLIRWVVLDVDDTMLDTHTVAFEKSQRTAQLLRLEPPTPQSFYAVFGRVPLEKCLARWHPGVTPEEYLAAYDTLRQEVPYRPIGPVARLVRQLGRDRVVGVLTNGPGVKTELKLAAAGVRATDLAFVRHADEGRCPKPDPRAFTELADDYGLDLSRTVYVSDSPADGRGARDAGAYFIGVLTGVFARGDFASSRVDDHLVDSLHDVPSALTEIEDAHR